MAVFMRLLGRLCIYNPMVVTGKVFSPMSKHCFPIPEVKLTFTSGCDESEDKLEKMYAFREDVAMQEYDKQMNKEQDRIRMEILKENGLGILSQKEEALAISSRMEEEGIYGKISMPDVKEPKFEDIVSKPKDGDQLVLEDWGDRMDWIVEAAELYHKRWINDPEYMKSELSTIAGWVDTPDEYPDSYYGTDLY